MRRMIWLADHFGDVGHEFQSGATWTEGKILVELKTTREVAAKALKRPQHSGLSSPANASSIGPINLWYQLGPSHLVMKH